MAKLLIDKKWIYFLITVVLIKVECVHHLMKILQRYIFLEQTNEIDFLSNKIILKCGYDQFNPNFFQKTNYPIEYFISHYLNYKENINKEISE